MSEVNYSESVIIPTLQKKVQDLQNSNLVLEVNLLVEQARHRDMTAMYSEAKNSLKTSSEQLDVEVNKAASFAHETNKLKTEIETISARTTALSNDLQHANTTINQIQSERNKFESERNELLNKCIREESLKNNAISEYNTLNAKYNELLEKIKLLEEESKKKSVKKVTHTAAMI
jgi:uncharacterized coiled-coil DUF342 family protein